MTSESQKRASTRYQAKNTKLVPLRFNVHTEADLLDWLEKQTTKAGYIKRLIREDMKRNQ